MKFYSFHLMPWPYLPKDFREKHETSWVIFSNEGYEPEKGAQLYQRYLDELAYADELGFDGVCVNEHHQTAYGSMPAPNIMAAALISKVKKGKIAVLGNAIPLRDNPIQIAEEIAMLDLLSGGRIINGFVRGIGAEYHSFSKDPTESRARFHEAHDLIIEAWTKKGPFEFYGKYYKFDNVNPWVLPLQKPHPPIWIPTQGSGETLDWAAEKRYTFVQTYSSISTLKKSFTTFKEAARKHGYEASAYQMGWGVPIYVADTDEKAEREAKEAIEYLFNIGLYLTPELFFPHGYLTKESMYVIKDKKGLGVSKFDFEYLLENGYILVGSADTVRQRIEELQKEFGFGNLLPLLQFGNLSHEKTMENIKLFAEKVMTPLRKIKLT